MPVRHTGFEHVDAGHARQMTPPSNGIAAKRFQIGSISHILSSCAAFPRLISLRSSAFD
jgi:hypothetical protein